MPEDGGGGEGGKAGAKAPPCPAEERIPASSAFALCESEFCSQDDVLCLDLHDAQPLCLEDDERNDEAARRALDAGSTIRVKVFGPTTCKTAGRKVSITLGKINRGVRLFAPEKMGARETAEPWTLLASEEFLIPNDPEVAKVTVRVAHDDEPRGTYAIPVSHGRYVLRPALLLTVVPEGRRSLSTRSVAGTGNRALAVDEGVHFGIAFALNYYPWGREVGSVSPLIETKGWHAWRQTFGVQVGMGLNLSDVDDEFYFGVLFEPVSGLAVSGGIALMELDYLPPGFPRGVLVPGDALPDPVTKTMARGYVGLTLNLDILETILDSNKRMSTALK